MLTIYHNARCSKSRQTLALIKEANTDVSIVEYLKTPLSAERLTALVSLLQLSPIDMMRTKEAEFKSMNLKKLSYNFEFKLMFIIALTKSIKFWTILCGSHSLHNLIPHAIIV